MDVYPAARSRALDPMPHGCADQTSIVPETNLLHTPDVRIRTCSVRSCYRALSGLVLLRFIVPRALPWARFFPARWALRVHNSTRCLAGRGLQGLPASHDVRPVGPERAF